MASGWRFASVVGAAPVAARLSASLGENSASTTANSISSSTRPASAGRRQPDARPAEKRVLDAGGGGGEFGGWVRGDDGPLCCPMARMRRPAVYRSTRDGLRNGRPADAFSCYDALAVHAISTSAKWQRSKAIFVLAPRHGLNSETLGVPIRGEEVVHVHE